MNTSVIIIGGGPAGYHSALSCRNAGMKVTLIEQNKIGGTCTHSGCIPTRAYLSAIKAREQLIGANPSAAGQTQLNAEELARTTQQKINQLTFGMDYMLHRNKVTIINDTAAITGVSQVTLSDGTTLTADHIIAATGSKSIVPKAHGFSNVFTVEELLTLQNLPQEITIVGGGVLGIELAVILQEFGCSVTLAERESRILPDWDEDISAHMQAYLEKLGIKVTLDAEKVQGENGVFCIGRNPNLPPIAADITPDNSWLHLIGDAGGGTMTADKAITQGQQIVSTIANPGTVQQIPLQAKCLFTPLEAASVGELAAAGDIVAYQDLGYTPSGVLFGTDLGMIKVVIDPNSHGLKGVHIVSHMASELIQIAQTAIAQNMTTEEFCARTFPHPTEGELLKEVVRSVL